MSWKSNCSRCGSELLHDNIDEEHIVFCPKCDGDKEPYRTLLQRRYKKKTEYEYVLTSRPVERPTFKSKHYISKKFDCSLSEAKGRLRNGLWIRCDDENWLKSISSKLNELGIDNIITIQKKGSNAVSPNIKYDEEANSSSNNSEIKPIQEFYKECLVAFHEKAKQLDLANNGLIFIPELIPIGEKIILEYLKDPYFQINYSSQPATYYLLIMALSFDAGLLISKKWHEDYSSMDQYVQEVIREGSGPEAEDVLKEYFNDNPIMDNQANPLFQQIYPIWIEKHEPYWKLEDPRDYTFKLMVAAYQLGVSVMLEKFGY